MQYIRVSVASGIAAAAILIGGVASAQSAAFSSEMGVGATGNEVTSLQTWLENNGYYSGPVTGYYGSLTMAGVENYQTAHDISATGYVGPLTLAALNAQASGSVGTGNTSELASLQAQLTSLLAEIQALEASGVTTTITTTSASGANITIQATENASVNANLTGSGSGTLTYELSASPSHGVITSLNTATGAFTYLPTTNYTGSDSFTYTVSNSLGTSAPMTVSINVEPNGTTSSGVPSGQAFSFTTSGGAAYNGTLNASGNSPFTYTISSQPSYGTISNFNSSNGTFTYTPDTNYTGSDRFTYTVSNSAGVSTPVTITINNNGTSSSGVPTGQNVSYTTASGAAYNGTLPASGTGTFTFAIASAPSHGIISSFSSSNGSFTYIPNNGFVGSDTFTYTVSNSSGTSVPYTVTITD